MKRWLLSVDLSAWLHDLSSETAATVLLVCGTVSTAFTFFISGVPGATLRLIGLGLIGVGFLWANFRVYRRTNTELRNLRLELAAQNQEFVHECEIEGTPPARQYLAVSANVPFQIARMDYLLADDTMMEKVELDLKGLDVKIPLEDHILLKVQNMPQPERNRFDGSCPVRLRIWAHLGSQTRQVVHPAWIQTKMVGSTIYRQVVG